jgi:hypothetical protein
VRAVVAAAAAPAVAACAPQGGVAARVTPEVRFAHPSAAAPSIARMAQTAAARTKVNRPAAATSIVEAKGAVSTAGRAFGAMLLSSMARASAAVRGRLAGFLESKVCVAKASSRGASGRCARSGAGTCVACLTRTAEASRSTKGGWPASIS